MLEPLNALLPPPKKNKFKKNEYNCEGTLKYVEMSCQ